MLLRQLLQAVHVSFCELKAKHLDEYWDYTHRIFDWPNDANGNPQYSNMILDDGCDATHAIAHR